MNKDFLGLLNIEDLNQRYADSYFKYGDHVVLCHGFHFHDFNPWTMIKISRLTADKQDSKTTSERFNPDKVTLERPRSGWYLSDLLGPFYLSYSTVKQFQRGSSEANTFIHRVKPEYTEMSQMWLAMDAAFQGEPQSPQLLNLAAAKLETGSIVKRHFLLYGNTIYYKAVPIASIKNNRTVEVFARKFKTDVLDLFIEAPTCLLGMAKPYQYEAIKPFRRKVRVNPILREPLFNAQEVIREMRNEQFFVGGGGFDNGPR